MLKILHISDTHGSHRRLQNLPQADMIIHSGDFTMNGSQAEALDFMNWFCDLPYQYKIFICGNHDECLYRATITGLDKNVFYLCNSGVSIEGLYIYGVPMFMNDCVTGAQLQHYSRIPTKTDILVTHTPPYEIMDLDDNIHYGSKELLYRISELNLKAHLFGHIHKQHGIQITETTIFSNGAIMNENYSDINEAYVIEII